MTRAMLLYNTLQAARAAAGEVGWSYLRLVGPGLAGRPAVGRDEVHVALRPL